MELVVKHFSELTADELYSICKLRVAVFVVEQNCPYQDIDDADRSAYHVYLKDDDGIAAYLRVLPKGVKFDEVSLGRVISAKRGCGLGSRIVAEGVQVAKDKFGAETVFVEAQTYARGFYEKSGFTVISDEFMEDGIPHVNMIRKL